MTVKGLTVKLKASALRKSKKIIKATRAFKVKSPQGPVTYKLVKGNKKFKVASSGRITVKKGTKKGKYVLTVKVKAAGNDNYKPFAKKVKVTVRVR